MLVHGGSRCGSGWFRLVQSGSQWLRTVLGSFWVVHRVSGWFRLVNGGSRGIRMVQAGSG